MSELGRFTVEQKVAEIDRELKQRDRVYGRLVERGKMTSLDAERKKDIMREIRSDIAGLKRGLF
jgi:hypothetical protein